MQLQRLAAAADTVRRPATQRLARAERAREAAAAEPAQKVFKIGVISAAIEGKPQTRNGHTWHFAQYLHPTFDWDAFKKHYPQAFDGFKKFYRNPKYHFDELPFADTQITHYYDADPAVSVPFTEVFSGVKVAKSVEEMANECDAIRIRAIVSSTSVLPCAPPSSGSIQKKDSASSRQPTERPMPSSMRRSCSPPA